MIDIIFVLSTVRDTAETWYINEKTFDMLHYLQHFFKTSKVVYSSNMGNQKAQREKSMYWIALLLKRDIRLIVVLHDKAVVNFRIKSIF